MPQLAVIFGGIEGLALSDAERGFYKECDPWGFILFARNCQTSDQVRALTDSLRELSGREDVPILIDQEGGRVVRLKAPEWRDAPPAACFGACYADDHDKGVEAARLNSRLLAKELVDLGINVDCVPVLDVPVSGAHDVIGDRAYAQSPEEVAILGRAAAEGLLDGGVLPVIKHMPGHGRTTADTHLELPRVSASLQELEATDFLPFKRLADMPLGMTAHLVFEAIDPDHPATSSFTVIHKIIRQHIGFDGLLMTDDLSMKALSGDWESRARVSLAAGCDVILHCNGDVSEMEQVAKGCHDLSGVSLERANRAMDRIGVGGLPDWDDMVNRLTELINPHWA